MHMPERSSEYRLEAQLLGRDHVAELLQLSSALHRRSVPILEATLGRPVRDRRMFSAVIWATPRQANTVAATLRRLIAVTSVDLMKGGDDVGTS
jgi:hypothetical protein